MSEHTDPGPDDQPRKEPSGDEHIEQFGTIVHECLAHREALMGVLAELEQAHLRGESVQSDLNRVFACIPALTMVARFAARGALAPALDKAVEHEVIEPSTRAHFEAFWRQVAWVTPGVKAFEFQEQSPEVQFWTDANFELKRVDDDVLVKHSFTWGVDEVHALRVPVVIMVNELILRLDALVRRLARADDVPASVVAGVLDRREQLEQVQDTFEQFETLAAADHSSETSPDSDGLGGLFGDPTASPDVTASSEDEDEDEGALRGFE